MNFWITLLDHRLAVITTTPLKKAANFNGRRIPCQLGVGENFRSADKHLRNHHEKPGFAQGYRLQLFPNPLGECRVATHEHRHIGAQAES